MTESGNGQESCKTWQVPDESLCPDLFAEIEQGVALKHRTSVSRNPDQRDGPRVECGVKIEVIAEFSGSEGMHGPVQCPASEQVDTGCLELACARSKEDKVELVHLDMAMHLVEEIGEALDFVDHHPTARFRCLQIPGEEGWIDEIVLIARLIEEIDPECIGKLPSRPGTLAYPTQAEQEETLSGLGNQSRV